MRQGSSELIVKNANFEKVLFTLDKHLKDRYNSACSCPRCMSDMTALALNYLPPHYYVDTGGGNLCASPWVMIENAVMEAIERVMENPRHEWHSEPSL